MKYAYWLLAVLSFALGATYIIAESKWLLGVLWMMHGATNGFIGAMSD